MNHIKCNIKSYVGKILESSLKTENDNIPTHTDYGLLLKISFPKKSLIIANMPLHKSSLCSFGNGYQSMRRSHEIVMKLVY